MISHMKSKPVPGVNFGEVRALRGQIKQNRYSGTEVYIIKKLIAFYFQDAIESQVAEDKIT